MGALPQRLALRHGSGPVHLRPHAAIMDLSHLQQIGLNMANPAGYSGTRSSGQSKPQGKAKASIASKGGPVVTRFAPSPTGYLHIGGARTSLFNYLFARHHGGKFLMRIEDTDEERHNEAAVDAIIKGMTWLGTPHDGEIVRQRSRCARHQEVAKQLLANGGAYKCYCSKEELEAMRAEAEKKKIPFRYPGTYRNVPKDFKPPPGIEPVVRIKTPNDDGVTGWEDGVMGRIEIPNKDVDDFIILRADGTPTYLLAVVVDDHDMGVTQVIRGSDHIGNTSRQIAVFKNMGWDLPNFAHLPLIHGPDGKKLSKRHGATGLEEFEAKGYLPEAIRNYLARLSWGHGDDEIFSTEQAIEWFDLAGCSKGAPCFDYDKLNNMNQHYIKEADTNRLTDILLKLYPKEIGPFEQKFRDPQVADMLKVRAKTLVEYKEAAEFFMAKRPMKVSPAAAKDMTSDAAKKNLRSLANLLETYKGEWTPAALEPCVKGFASEQGLKLGEVAKPARGALTGSTASPGLFEVIWVVGKDEVIGRLRDAADGAFVIQEPPPPPAAASPEAAEVPTAPASAPAPQATNAGSLSPEEAEKQAKIVGDEIRDLKQKLKASGLSGKKIDASEDVKALVAKLQGLKTAASAAPSAPSTSAAPAASASDAEGLSPAQASEQAAAVGEEIRNLKQKLKASGLSGKKIDASDEVKALVAKLQALKAVAAAAS